MCVDARDNNKTENIKLQSSSISEKAGELHIYWSFFLKTWRKRNIIKSAKSLLQVDNVSSCYKKGSPYEKYSNGARGNFL